MKQLLTKAPATALGVWILALLSLWSALATAATAVSGAISADTVWRKSDGPYQVTADVTIEAGAAVTIEPGTVVYFAQNANLIVNDGALIARGTIAEPILFTSQLESTSSAAPGSWGQLRFLAATDDARTVIEHATVRFGAGLVVHGSAPTLNHVVISDHAGPAISIDLQASPRGENNQAFNNQVNGVVVPAGVITGTASWRLKGIPYVLMEGELSVGAAPSITGISPNQIEQGQTLSATISGTRLSGGETVSFGTGALAATVADGGTDTALPISVSAAAGATRGTFPLDVQVAAGKAHLDNAITIILPQPRVSAISPSTVYANRAYSGFSVLGSNFDTTSVVVLNGADVATTFINATTLSVDLAAQTAGEKVLRVRSADPTQAGAYFFSNAFSFLVVTPSIGITPTSSTIRVGGTQTYTVSIPFAAGAGGVSIDMVSGVPSVAGTTSPIVIGEGATSVTATVNGLAAGSATITASSSGFNSAQAALTVVPPPAITFNPTGATISKGRVLSLQIQLSEPAPAGGVTLALASSNPAVVSVPATATFAAGAQTANVTANALELGTATITASGDGYTSGSSSLSVQPVTLSMPAGVFVAPGLSRSLPINLSEPAPAGGLVVTLVSANSAVATVTETVTVAEGQSAVNVSLSGVAAGATTVTASAPGYDPATTSVTVQSVNIALSPTGNLSVPETVRSNPYTVTISQPAPTGGLTVALQVADATIASVEPASVFIPQGQTSSSPVTVSITGILKGSTTLSAASPGLNSATMNIAVTGRPVIRFNKSAVVVGKGLRTYSSEVYVYRQTDNQNYSPNTALTVNLTSSDPTKVAVPATVTIPANTYYVYFPVDGIDVTDTPVTIDATAQDYVAPTTKLAATTIVPKIQLLSLDNVRNTLSARDDFTLRFNVPGAAYPTSQTAVSPLTVNLTAIDSGTNLAKGALLSMSSINGTNTPDKATDSNPNTFTATNYHTHPWWQADLGQETTFQSMNVYPYGEARYVILLASTPFVEADFTATALPTTYSNGATVLYDAGTRSSADPIRLSGPFTGRYVRIVNIEGGYQYLADVEILQGGGGTSNIVSFYDAATAGNLITQVTVPANASTTPARFVGQPTATGAYKVNAAIPAIGASESSYPQVANAADLRFVFSKSSVVVGKGLRTYTNEVYIKRTLNGADYSPNTALTVNLTSSDPTKVAVPATVTIPANTYYVYFPVDGIDVTDTPVTIDATAQDYLAPTTKLAATTIVPKIQLLSLDNVRNTLSARDDFTLRFNVPGAAYPTSQTAVSPLTVNLTAIDSGTNLAKGAVLSMSNLYNNDNTYAPDKATDSDPNTYTATNYHGHSWWQADLGQETTFQNLNVYPYSAGRYVILLASTAFVEADFSNAALPTTYSNGATVLYTSGATSSIDPIRLSGPFTGRYVRIVNIEGGHQYLADVEILQGGGGTSNIVSFYDAATAGNLITQVTVAANASTTPARFVGQPTATGAYKVNAAIPAIGASESSYPQVANAPDLRVEFSTGSIIVGKGLRSPTTAIFVRRTLAGANYSDANNALTVNLACTATTICSVPATVTIPAGTYYVYFQVDGLELGTTTVSASATGYASGADMNVSVVTPNLVLNNVPATLAVNGTANFFVQVTVPNGLNPSVAISARTLNLVSSAPSVATLPATVTLPAGANQTANVALTGVASGTTTITASGTGFNAVTSGTVTVGP